MKFTSLAATLALTAATLVSSSSNGPNFAAEKPIPCQLKCSLFKKFRQNIIGINTLSDGRLLLSQSNGYGIEFDGDISKHRTRLLAPAHKESCSHSEDSVEFETMSVSTCRTKSSLPELGLESTYSGYKAEKDVLKTLFDYRVKGDKNPSVAYSTHGPFSKWFCELFPRDKEHPKTLEQSPSVSAISSSLFASLAGKGGNLVFVVDYDKNAILVQVGTSKADCDNPLIIRCFKEKITAFASCCNLPLLFVGFEDGEVHIYMFVSQHHSCHGKLICIKKIPASCSCNCVSPVPVGIALCCDNPRPLYTRGVLESSPSGYGNIGAKLTASILYRKAGYKHRKHGDKDSSDDEHHGKSDEVKTFIRSIEIEMVFTNGGSHPVITVRNEYPIIVNSEIIDFRVCCDFSERCIPSIYAIVRSCKDRVFLVLYDLRTGAYKSKALLPCKYNIRAWTVQGCERVRYTINRPLNEKELVEQPEALLRDYGCCAYFIFELPAPCDDCNKCPPKTALARFCCEPRLKQVVFENYK
jgi:hypothetical protein